ncbi:MAG: inosine monophosphate cyclohydrolase [bacterium]|nr:inosine monophosphate cyclohydrolase [bacterium]
MNIETHAERLKNSTYPGRGIILGQTPDEQNIVQVYWIMGRSEGSRNRAFISEGSTVKTEAFDESKLENPSLVVYHPIKIHNNAHILTNGDQTDTIFDYLQNGDTFESALCTRTFEPDPPIYTPRISGIVDLDDTQHIYKLAILKTIALNGDYATRHFFNYETAIPGIGHCITTYQDNGNPPPSFSGEPFCVELFDNIAATADFYWDLLDEANRVSLLVKYINPEAKTVALKIVNKYQK